MYYANVTIHLLAALVWLGGMLFLVVVGAPVLRGVGDPALRAALFRRLGEQFRLVGWICIGVLVATGLLNLWFRGQLRLEVLGSGSFWRTPYGVALAWKLGAVGVMVGASAVHDFLLGPRASRAAPGSAAARRLRAASAWTARLNAVVALVLVYVAVRLARGG